jgi:hypothetical protein
LALKYPKKALSRDIFQMAKFLKDNEFVKNSVRSEDNSRNIDIRKFHDSPLLSSDE